jgi:hypothetical protein
MRSARRASRAALSSALSGFEVFQIGFERPVLHGVGLGGQRDVAVAERVGPVEEGVGIVPVLKLLIESGEVLGGGEVVRIGVVFLDNVVAALFELLLGETGAGGFFEFLEFRRVFHERTHVSVFVPLGLLHRGAGGAVLGALDRGAVGRVMLDDVVINFRRLHRLVAADVELGQLVKKLGVFGAALADGFQGEGGAFEEVELEEGVE